MNIVEELRNYCDLDNPVGALMLSGEWGCGKTYLIKKEFIPSVKDTYVFLWGRPEGQAPLTKHEQKFE